VLHCKARYDGRPKIVAPQVLVHFLFAYFHDSPLGGHLGVSKTIHKVRQSFIWKGMDAYIATWVKVCRDCGLSKPARTRYGMLSSEVASRPMEKIFIALWGNCPFQVGARVWLRNFPTSKAERHISAKLCPRYKGPYTIAEFTTPVSVRLQDAAGESMVRAHVSQQKPA
jgi:hypothetical protein